MHLKKFLLFIFLILSLNACRTTGVGPGTPVYISTTPFPQQPYAALAPEVQAPATQAETAESKLPLLFLTLVILATLIIIFASDGKVKKEVKRKPRKTRKRKKK